jgi:enoyl-CoA hydratase/carnithine racemase
VVAIPYRFITYQCDGPVAMLTLVRSQQDQGVHGRLAEEIRHACQEVRQDDLVRVVILTGSGGTFARGREPLPPELSEAPADQRMSWIASRRVADDVAGLPVPVIVSVNGDALDHGLELALAGDLRISAATARFGLTDLSRPGGFPWDGGTQRLPRLVGPAWASDLILTSRTISAAEALNIGLVNRVVPSGELAQEAQRLAGAVSAGGPIAARYAREAITRGADLGLAEGLRLEAVLIVILLCTEVGAEGLRSFGDRGRARFTGR